QDKYGVVKTSRNNGPVAKATQSIKRHDKKRAPKKQLTNKKKRNKSSVNEEGDSLTLLERQIALEERRLELEERKEKLREKKLLNYEKAHELGVEEELG
ncbi:3822_t:CDS:2, partial [Gigaspora rosea]